MIDPSDVRQRAAPAPGGAPAGRRRPLAVTRAAVATWSLVSGYLLLFAPLTDRIWNETFWEGHAWLQRVLFLREVRLGISVVGVLLLATVAWDAVVLLQTSRAERRP